MPIRRVFLGWDRPGLPAAAEWLNQQYSRAGHFDLTSVIVAVPGGRVGRRLIELLVELADEKRQEFTPPQVVTAGALPELLYQAKKPFADDLTQHLAWASALRGIERRSLGRLIRHSPESEDLFSWLPLGEMLSTLHRELAADGLDFNDVLSAKSSLPVLRDTSRWEVLSELQARYLGTLDSLEQWDRQTARLYAIRHQECRTANEIVLVGTVDMNRAQREMLDQVAERVTTLIVAPSARADDFDEHGCVIPEAWQNSPVPLRREQVTVVDGPGDQADAVIRKIAAYGGRYSAEEIVVGVPDEDLVPYILQRLTECELPGRYGVGVSLSRSEPARLLEAFAAWLETSRFDAFATLLRHPALQKSLFAQGVADDCLTAMDLLHAERLPLELDAGEIQQIVEELHRAESRATDEGYRARLAARRRSYDCLLAACKALAGWTESFPARKRPLGEWGDAIAELLIHVFGTEALSTEDSAERVIVQACSQISAALAAHRNMHDSLMPNVTAAEAIRLVLQSLAKETSPPPSDVPSIELLGWLELPLDDAPALIVSGLNERVIPSSRNGDLFLPNELRKLLKLEDNDRRYARDCYALHVLAASRDELHLIAGRRTADNDPLIPSRLLLSADVEEMAARVLEWMGDRSHAPKSLLLPGSLRPGPATPFRPPRPRPLRQPVESMRVTEFRDYLACPYRYYLKHRLALAQQADGAVELHGGQFGTLMHDALSDFGLECRNEPVFAATTNARNIALYLDERLDALVRQRYGANPLPAVRVQVELIRRRLQRFAEWQAEWARLGWRIHAVEQEIPGDKAALPLASGAMKLRGRIDRIDIRDSGEAIIFDYKTGDSDRPPEKTHRDKATDTWLDLQLPLYQFAGRWMELGDRIHVGYIVLPRKEEAIGDRIAGWEQPLFDDAIREAIRVAELVRAETFWPPANEPPGTLEEFSAICGDYRFVPAPDEELAEASESS